MANRLNNNYCTAAIPLIKSIAFLQKRTSRSSELVFFSPKNISSKSVSKHHIKDCFIFF